jgi:SAM-dependent methyltransferase
VRFDAVRDGSGHDLDRLFDAPSSWRVEAAQSLGLSGEALLAGVSPGAWYPDVLRAVLAGLRSCDPSTTDAVRKSTPCPGKLDLVVDIGAGVGGISEWFRRRSGGIVVAVEPRPRPREAAATLFPSLVVRSGTAELTGVAAGTADAVLCIGVISLIADVDRLMCEAERIVRPGGALAVADVFSATGRSLRSGPNVFHGLDQVTTDLGCRGWSAVGAGAGSTTSDPAWAAAGARVDGWIRAHRSGHPDFPIWDADQAHLRRHCDDGDLVAGWLVARRRP